MYVYSKFCLFYKKSLCDKKQKQIANNLDIILKIKIFLVSLFFFNDFFSIWIFFFFLIIWSLIFIYLSLYSSVININMWELGTFREVVDKSKFVIQVNVPSEENLTLSSEQSTFYIIMYKVNIKSYNMFQSLDFLQIWRP